MSKTGHAIVTVLSLTVGLGAAHYYVKSSERGSRRANVAEDRTRNPSERDPQLEQRLLELSAEVAALRARNSGEPPAVASGDAGLKDGAAPPKTNAEERQERREYLADVEASFYQERPDPGWARETAASIRQDATEFPAVASALRSSDCRSSSCRVELGPTDSEDLSRELPVFFHHLSNRLPTVQFDQIDVGGGRKNLVAYLSRESEASAKSGPPLE